MWKVVLSLLLQLIARSAVDGSEQQLELSHWPPATHLFLQQFCYMHLSGLFLCADKPQRPKGLHALPTTVSSSGCCSAGVPVTLTQRKAFEVQKWCRKNNTLSSFFSLFLLLTHFGLGFFFFCFATKQTPQATNQTNLQED